jgi:hypothetical protein
MRRTFSILSLVILQTIFSGVIAQDVTVRAAFDTSRIYIGDQIFYIVTIDQPAGVNLTLPVKKDTLTGKIEILAGPVFDTVTTNGNRFKITGKYLITSFDSGFYQVPPFYAEVRNESGIRRFYSDYSLLEVMRVKIAPADTTARIFDIIEPYKAPLTLGEIIPWLLIAAIMAALLWFLCRLFKRLFRRKGKPEVVINPDPAHIIAFRDLELLKEENLWQKGEVKQYYSRLTEIVRQYLENRYQVFSLELTTSETLEELVRTGFKRDEVYNNLKTILTGADLVKFAKYKPEPAENDLHFHNAWEFVDLTRLIEVTIEKDQAPSGKEVAS